MQVTCCSPVPALSWPEWLTSSGESAACDGSASVCLCSSPLCPPLSGFPESVPVYTVNRQCSSGLQALFNIAGRTGALRHSHLRLYLSDSSLTVCAIRSHQEQRHRPGPGLRVGLPLYPQSKNINHESGGEVIEVAGVP